MTCYFRHMKNVFTRAGLEITDANKRAVDQAIHDLVGVDYKNCSATWKKVKQRLKADEEDFVSKLKQALS
ncbi:MAG: hypothetical protein NWE78_04955 [Candidatus Bathyarchaeota archaeon]|nr:hypothetical protein [Candidatus Bathyarchaeota archaeon]